MRIGETTCDKKVIMAADQQFCLRWNNHQSTLISVFDTLLASGQLVDCTLAAEGQYLKAHKVVLSACSPYLEVLLSQHYEKHPIVILKDVKFQELKSMMDYMYRGEVNISQDQLGTFLKAAESLQIKGLSDSGGENDSRDVGSTNKRQDVPAPATRKASVPTSQPRSPAVIPQSSNNSGLTIEPRRSHVDIPPSSPLRSREGSVSPTPRKRRRQRRPSQGDENQLSSDSHIDTSNSCDLPSQAQSTSVPTIPATMTPVVPSSAPSSVSKPEPEQPPLETEQLNRLGTSINSTVSIESGLIKEKLEPTSELLLEPKTEYMDEVNNEDSVEDLTLDDDDDMDSNLDMSRPGPSHVDSNQGFTPWQHMQSGDRSGTDEVFMAAQEAVGAHRDSQEICSPRKKVGRKSFGFVLKKRARPGCSVDLRMDGVDHYPAKKELKNPPHCRSSTCARRTRYECEKCKVPVCPQCMKQFHSQ